MKKLLLSSLFSIFVLNGTAFTQTIEEYKKELENITIQARIDALSDGDTLTILKDEFFPNLIKIRRKKNIVIRNPYNFKIQTISHKAFKLINCDNVEILNLIFITSDLKGMYNKRTINRFKQKAYICN